MAVLVFESRTAWTWIISSYLLLHMDRHLGLRLASIGGKVAALGLHSGHILLRLRLSRLLCLVRISQEDRCTEKE